MQRMMLVSGFQCGKDRLGPDLGLSVLNDA